MDADVKTQLAFHVLGRNPAGAKPAGSVGRLRPALLAAFRDLATLRHDYPLVLVRDAAPGEAVQTLTSIVNAILQKVAPRGAAGERKRRQVLRLERAIRERAAQGGSLSAVWDDAAVTLAAQADAGFAESVAAARAALAVDGDLVDCTAETPVRIVRHVWRLVQEQKLAGLVDRVEKLVLKLTDVLMADHVRSEAGRAPDALAAAVGPGFSQLFDFGAMSELLGSVSAAGPVSKRRRRRIEEVLAVLEAQPLLTALRARDRAAEERALADLVFGDCATALKAWRERRPALVSLVKAIAIAELEIEGRYSEAEHDGFFAAFNEASLGASDLALGPDMLVCIEDVGALRRAEVLELLSAGVPVKVLVLTNDLLGDPVTEPGGPTLSGTRLATMATGLDDVFVLQSTVASLGRCGARIARGLAYAGPALVSVYTGAASVDDGMPTYLRAAAAMQARVFPSFTYDPSAGVGLAARWDVADNPQPDQVWSVHPFACEDAAHLRITTDLAFTAADVIVADPRHAGLFSLVASEHWSDTMVPVDVWLREPPTAAGAVPYVPVVDDGDRLYRAVASEPVIAAARRCREAWHRLQELGDIHNSWAERRSEAERLAREEAAREAAELAAEEAGESAAPAPAPAPAKAKAAAKEAAKPEVPAAAEPATPSGEAFIETPRCTSCNACLQVNARLFQYDGNKQAVIADASAGTYRQLVEAAESCPVGIIHPGEPRNPNEPDLDELRGRAKPFR
ncbi:MAG: ferredoxin [Rhodoplanes sp.]|uniref:ferredoxin n=1 Tax=Rhodoplanes sp. TaxID=1968906 RepID=UPI0017CD5B07|nr:ferredoxin [Rhodoplanes sp.]NVO16691.1 ferredoxin [Rhodoplanes sp.]